MKKKVELHITVPVISRAVSPLRQTLVMWDLKKKEMWFQKVWNCEYAIWEGFLSKAWVCAIAVEIPHIAFFQKFHKHSPFQKPLLRMFVYTDQSELRLLMSTATIQERGTLSELKRCCHFGQVSQRRSNLLSFLLGQLFSEACLLLRSDRNLVWVQRMGILWDW